MEIVDLNPEAAVDRYAHPCQNGIKTFAELEKEVFKEPVWIVPGVIPEGATILAAKPKVGKSFMALDIALAISTGGMVFDQHTTQQDVLYLSLEDGSRRLHNRVTAMVASGGWPDNLYYQTSWPSLDDDGITRLREWLVDHPDVKLVTIDTLAKMRSRKTSRKTQYELDYHTVEPFKVLCDELGISIIVIHHSRKAPSEDDPFDVISGTTGLTAVFDTCLVLRQSHSGNVYLYSRGRDMEEVELVLKHDVTGNWVYLGRASSIAKTEERNSILDAMDADKDYSQAELVLLTGKRQSGLCQLLNRMVQEREILRTEQKKYRKKEGGKGSGQ